MKGTYLGEFEELVLLTIAALEGEAYGVAIKDDIETRTKRPISIGSLHSTITRLEDKGFVVSELGGATKERGGRRKRYFKLTRLGIGALNRVKIQRDELWDISKLKLEIDNGH